MIIRYLRNRVRPPSSIKSINNEVSAAIDSSGVVRIENICRSGLEINNKMHSMFRSNEFGRVRMM